ncbi:MAG: hypothetical protein IKI43_02855, partial [Campylobacter sp.]|nr:hypothetical protein [Campylobacter sp.]
ESIDNSDSFFIFVWHRISLNFYKFNAKFYNIPEMLVKMRAGKSQLSRRGGLKYAISEFRVQREFYKFGFLNFYEFARNSSVKFIVRLLPKAILSKIYLLLRNKN